MASSEARHPPSSSSPPVSHSCTADAEVGMLQAKSSPPACEGRMAAKAAHPSSSVLRDLRGDSTKARKEIALILCQLSPPTLVIPLRSAQGFIPSWALSFEGRSPAREMACESKRRREESSDVDPSAAGDVRPCSAPSTKQTFPTNPPSMSARAQDPQGQGLPSIGSAVTNFLIRKRRAEDLPLQPAWLRAQGTQPSLVLHLPSPLFA